MHLCLPTDIVSMYAMLVNTTRVNYNVYSNVTITHIKNIEYYEYWVLNSCGIAAEK